MLHRGFVGVLAAALLASAGARADPPAPIAKPGDRAAAFPVTKPALPSAITAPDGAISGVKVPSVKPGASKSDDQEHNQPGAKTGTARAPSRPAPHRQAPGLPGSEELETGGEGLCGLAAARLPIAPAINEENGCAIPRPVAFAAAGDGGRITLAPEATVGCGFARRVEVWLATEVAAAARAEFDVDLASVRVAAGYVCRGRNNQAGAKLSEHAYGNAIDLSAFRLSDGREIVVASEFGKASPAGRFLAAIRKSACAAFTTVLSPAGDAFHQDHIHLDSGCHGRTCTYRICE